MLERIKKIKELLEQIKPLLDDGLFVSTVGRWETSCIVDGSGYLDLMDRGVSFAFMAENDEFRFYSADVGGMDIRYAEKKGE